MRHKCVRTHPPQSTAYHLTPSWGLSVQDDHESSCCFPLACTGGVLGGDTTWDVTLQKARTPVKLEILLVFKQFPQWVFLVCFLYRQVPRLGKARNLFSFEVTVLENLLFARCCFKHFRDSNLKKKRLKKLTCSKIDFFGCCTVLSFNACMDSCNQDTE